MIGLLNLLFNDLILFVANLVVDILLVLKIKANFKIKKENFLKMNQNASLNKINAYLNELHKKSNDLNFMILYMLVGYVFSRMPELLVYLTIMFVSEFFGGDLKKNIFYNEIYPISLNVVQCLFNLSYL